MLHSAVSAVSGRVALPATASRWTTSGCGRRFNEPVRPIRRKIGATGAVVVLRRFDVALLRPKKNRSGARFREYTTLRCPFNGHQVSWCRGLCVPIDGSGICGRIAAHSMVDRTQTAIANYLELRPKRN